MPESTKGRTEQLEGSYVIRFERRYDRPVEDVWEAITRPERMKDWLGASEIDLDLAPGGRMVTRATEPQELVDAIIEEAGEAALESHDIVLRVEPPRLFEHTFGGSPTSVVRWELEADGDGCVLRLAHTNQVDIDTSGTPSYLAGWHELLDQLTQTFELPREQWSQWSKARWQTYKDRYADALR